MERPPRLLIIDFGVSIRVDDEDTTIEGFRGTLPWVAPEVGMPNGPTMEYSPIRADRWACGQMMTVLKRRFRGGPGPDQMVRALESVRGKNCRTRHHPKKRMRSCVTM